MFNALLSLVWGPLVRLRHVGFEQRLPTRLASVSTTGFGNSSRICHLLPSFAGLRQRLDILLGQHLVRPPLRALGVNPDVAIADFERRADGGFKLGWAEIVLREVGHVPAPLLVVHPEAEPRLHLCLV